MTPTELTTTESIAPRTAANRINCQSSTGPKTDAGKDRVRHNALQHGLYAASAVIPGESHDEYVRLGTRLAERYTPLTPEDKELVATLQDAQWRLKRVIALESRLLVLSAAKHLESVEAEFGSLAPEDLHGLAVAAAYRADSRIFAQLNRQEARLRKLIETTTKALESSASSAPALTPARTDAPAIPTPQDAVGFVPSLPVAPPPPASQPAQSAQPASAPLPKMPKFSGPQASRDRKNWLRKQKQLGRIA